MSTSLSQSHGRRLAAGCRAEKMPRHIAVIMDGNGRWARQRGLPRIEGHRHGVTSVRRTTEECARLGIRQLTLYCFSSENWKRPQEELDFLMQPLEQYMVEERDSDHGAEHPGGGDRPPRGAARGRPARNRQDRRHEPPEHRPASLPGHQLRRPGRTGRRRPRHRPRSPRRHADARADRASRRSTPTSTRPACPSPIC